MAELTKEVDRHREIINGILPAYVRIRETVDRLENDVSRLRQKVRDQDRVLDRQRHIIGVFNERYHNLRTHIYGDDEENDEDEMPDFIRPEEYGPANFGAEEAGPMDLRADNDIGEVRPEEPRDVVVRPSDGTPKEDRTEEARPEDVRPEEPKPKDVQQMGVRPIESFFYWKKKEKRVEGPNDTLQDGEREVTNVSEERGKRTGVTDLAESLDVTGVSASQSEMLPPATPAVKIQPPTPVTSQESTTGPQSHLAVPEESSSTLVNPSGSQVPEVPEVSKPLTRSRSTSAANSDLRRSPRLRSKSPSPLPFFTAPAKRPADTVDDAPFVKKQRHG